MSDFLLPTQKNDFWNQYENKNNNVQNQNTQTDYWQNQSQKTMEQKQAQLDNRERYGVNVPDEYYEVFNKIISQAATPEEAQAEAYKIGSAVKYSQMMSIPLEEAYKNVDALNEAQFPDKLDQKGRFEALADMWTLGKNNVKLGELGQKLMRANAENDTELSKSLMAEIDALNQQNQLMQDNAPRSWVMQALEAGAQSLPFTAAVAGAGIDGNFIAPAAGTGASFAASSYLSAGTEYIDMLANGASPETARAVAMVSGGIQGLIEADLGITKGIVKGAARVAGKEVAENTAKKGLEEIGRKVFKRFHFGAGKKVLINYLENRGKDILGEGTEEFLQEITSIVGQEVAASLEGYDIPDDDFKSIVKQTTEAFRGGVLGALSMGFIPAGLNAAADVSSFKAIKDGAEVIESEEVFKEAVKDNPVFEGMSEQQKTETIHDVWQNAQNRKEEAANLEAQKIAEGRDAAEGAEEAPEENEDGTTEAQAVARNDAGRLYTSDDVSTDDEGNVTGGTFVIGDKTKSENNRYGYITYKTDEDGNITIENFKMTAEREGLRNEAFDEFAREHPDVNIEWNTIGSEAQGFKDALIEANPSGKNNGLNYYTTNELDNVAARKMVAEEVRRNIHNVKQNADGSYSRTELNNKQVAAAVTLIESAARRQNMGLAEYVSKTFGNQIFGSREEFAEATLAQGENVATKAGGMSQGVAQANWREVGQMVKAVIYAGENADFSTWAHEMAHVFQAQLDGDLKSEAEAAFNVVGGDWTRSTYTFSDGRTMSSAEAFAYGFQDWLETGKAESEQMKNIFQKFAEFIADAYNKLRQHLNFTPEIESVFNKLLDGDDTVMSKALKAAEEQEGEYRAGLKRAAEEKEAQKKAAAEEAQRQAEAEREEKSETTEYAENAPTAEELINGIEEVENEKEPETNAIDNALKDLPLTDEQKTEIADVLKDENSTRVDKAEAVTEAAESAYVIPDDMFFQEEYDAVRAQYENTDKWMKAPNGEDTNLTEKQWLQVRTPSFKKWFGDWENDKENASKVLDENGEPLVVYHGTDADFTIFDASKSRANMDIQGNFFSPWDIDAQGYGPNVRAFYLNIRKPANSSQGYSTLNTYKGQNEAGIKARELLKSKGYDGVNNDNEEYITFEPNQIKSATDNNGNFDANNPDILFQIIGEIGAQNLDDSEVQEGVTRMQDLVTAKEMEKEGKDAKTIRTATAWERGGDGKWKYEIDDSKVNFDSFGMIDFNKSHPRLNELSQKLIDGKTLTDSEQKEYDELNAEYGKVYDEQNNSEAVNYFGKKLELSKILDNEELFKAYPKLKNIIVEFKPQSKDGTAGSYNELDNRITLYVNSKDEWLKQDALKSTLLHEVQHAIQRIEGFAKGGNVEQFKPRIRTKDEVINKDLQWAESLEDSYPDKKAEMQEIKSLMLDGNRNQAWEKIHALQKEAIEKDDRDYARYIDEYGYKLDKIQRNIITEDIESPEQQYRRLAGETEARNVQTRINFTPKERRNTLLAATEDVAPEDKIILFQQVYHGSGADFDKFDTEHYGLSGEGSMTFGYGTYFTDSEDIARDYAERQRPKGLDGWNYKGKPINSYPNSFDLREVLAFLSRGEWSKEGAIKEITELKESYEKSGSKEITTTGRIDDLNKLLNILNDKDFSVDDFDLSGKTRLYTVEIPDDGYLDWEKQLTKEQVIDIANKFFDYAQRNNIDIDASKLGEIEEWSYEGTVDGDTLYNRLKLAINAANTAKIVSQFLHSIGYAGIKYPAGTIHGNGNGAYNYVIFNDEDAQIVDKLLFQTQAELMNEAQDFESWQEFMEYCETFHADDEVSPIPSDADAQWYQTFWETSNGVKTEQEKNEEALKATTKKDTQFPAAVDALFTTMIRSAPQMVDSFLQAVADIDAMDLDSEEWRNVDNAEDAAQREKIDQLKDFINITLSDYNWQTALRRIQGGHEISEGLRKRLIGEMTDSFKARDFRALYAEVMNDPQYAVADEDSITASLNKKLKKYHDIVKPTDDISRWSPERRKQLAEQLQNREIAAKIKSGSLKLDDELDAYIKSLNSQIKEKQKQFDELEAETKSDYQRIADKERRDLLKLHEQLLLASGKLKSRNAEIERKIKKGLKITEKYRYITQNLNANYDELFRKYNDLRNSITLNAEVQAALERQEQLAGIREDLNAKQKEKNLTSEVKKMRIQLVKKAMRRVPFARIDYNNARTVIAIQRMLEPNLLGGVNRFIGIDSPYLRGVISQIVTDSEYKEKILNYLNKNTKASQAFADFKKKLEDLKTIKDFDSWTAKDRKAAIRYLPKENWVRDLNLLQLAKEREESIDLDIGMEEYNKTVYDEKTGEPKTYKDKDGQEHNVTETGFRLQYDDELGQMVKDAVGADMFDKIVNMPFAEWTTEDLESLAQRIDEIYIEGRDLKAAKDEARKREAAEIRKRIEDAIKETGITFNDDDTPEERERKQKKIDKILGMNSDLKGTEAGKAKGPLAKLDRLIHGYYDMNVLRFARMLDGQSEGENVRMLYRREDDCYIAKQRSMDSRASAINKVMADNKITEGDLAKTVKVPELGTEFTVDELLYFLAADKDYVEDEKKLQKGEIGIDANDDYAATSRNAVMFGNMMSDMMSQEEKESWAQLDKEMEEALKNDTLTQEQKEELATGRLDKKPGTTRYIAMCHAKWETVLGVANNYLSTHPEYKALMEAIEADYASQYERMNEVSIAEFNQPVHRVKAYVPLVRRESNGDTNENQVREDLLGAAGVGKQWADRGMTQRRVQISPLNQKPVQTGLFRTWGDSIERTEHFIAYAPYVRQLNAIYKSRDAAYTRRFIESRYGKYAVQYLDEYINEVANPNAGRIREKGAELLHVLRGKTAPAYLGWKASGIIKQGLTSPWPYMQFVNPAEYTAAALKFTFNPEMRDAISEKSIYMKMRRMDPVNDLIDEMAENAKGKVDRAWSKFSQIGMQGLEMIDWACVAPGWLACYEKKYNQLQNASNARYEARMAELKERNLYADVGTSEYLSPEQMEAEARREMTEDIETEAVRYADDCTRACQPSNRVTDLAPLFKNSSEAMKAFLQFQTSLNVIWQNLRYDMPYAVKQREFKRIAGTVIGYVCAGIFMNSVMEGIGGDDDDDDTQALRNLIYYSTTQFTDAIPIMGSEITNAMDKIITGSRAYSQSGTDMTPSATKLLNALQKATSGDWQKAASLTAEAIGLFMGAPVSGVKEINKLLGKPLANGDVNLARGITDVYGIAGDILEE